MGTPLDPGGGGGGRQSKTGDANVFLAVFFPENCINLKKIASL